MSAKLPIIAGFLQGDLDCNFHKLINLDTSNLPFGASPPSVQPPAFNFLDGWNMDTQQWHFSQPNIFGLANFPPVTGHAGQFLRTDGAQLHWETVETSGSSGGGVFINVKNDPYNARGDGVTDDFQAIRRAMLDATANGFTVYFPKGNYFVSQNLIAPGPISLLGENPYSSVIVSGPAVNGAILQVFGASIVRNLGFNGRAFQAATPAAPAKVGVFVGSRATNTFVENCLVFACSGSGIIINLGTQVVVRNCTVQFCGGYGIALNYSPRSIIEGNVIISSAWYGIVLANCQSSTVANNQVLSSGQYGYGIALFDSDNSTVTGNLTQQCAVGIAFATSQTRSFAAGLLQSYGLTCVGNNVVRNYLAGIIINASHGFQVTGNTISDNGQGGVDNAMLTAEPGLMVGLTNQGTGYALGDVVTVIGGGGTPAKAIVTKVTGGGAVYPDGLFVINYGAYTTFPVNPVSFSGGSGTGLKAFLSASRVHAGGSGYQVGQVLRATNGTFIQPVRVMVTATGTGGSVTAVSITDGGGYSVAPIILDFAGDALSPVEGPIVNPDAPPGQEIGAADLPDSGSGFRLGVCWAKRYSAVFNGQTSFGIATQNYIGGGIIGNNIIDTCRTGCGYLNFGTLSPFGRAELLCVTGNQVVNNLHSFKGQEPGEALDSEYNPLGPSGRGIFANNVIYPALS